MKVLIALLISMLLTAFASAKIVNRYSFTNDAKDTAGSADAQLKGTAAIAAGSVVLDGRGWVQINASHVPGQQCASVEAWFTYQPNGNWVRVFDFGNTNSEGLGANCWYFTPQYPEGSRTTFSNTDPGYTYEETIDNAPLTANVNTYIAVIFNSQAKTAKLYVNGRLIGDRELTVKLSDIGTQHLYLGKSSYNSDRPMKGAVSEFRIYNSPLSQMQILLNSQIGPDMIMSCPLKTAAPANHSLVRTADVDLSWTIDDTVTAQHYEVALTNDPNTLKPGHNMRTPTWIGNENVLKIDDLTAHTDYYWRVDIIDDTNNRHIGPVLKFSTSDMTE